MSRRIALLVGTALISLTAACTTTTIEASGTIVSEPRTVEAFTRLVVESGVNVRVDVVAGAATELVVRYDDNLADYVVTTESNDTLTIVLDAQVRFVGDGEERSVDVVTSALRNLEASGGSVVTVRDLAADLTLQASGGSVLTLSGSGDRLMVDASGGSIVTASAYDVRRVEVEASGGSIVTVQATETATGSASGGSAVTVLGGAMLDIETSGGSRVR